VTEQIRKLGDLRDDGVITDEEFETKKQELLSRL
jgi:putative oligomerization/nucleic acid binding protein